MRKFIVFVAMLLQAVQGFAALTIEITEGVEGALPIALVPFGWQGSGAGPDEDIAAIVARDLAGSGRFKPMPVADMLARPTSDTEVEFRDWKVLGMENLVVGRVLPNGSGGYLVRFQLFDVFRGAQLASHTIPTTQADLRATAHQIADFIYQQLTGERGAFATRIAYIVSQGSGTEQRITLQIADADGQRPQTIVTSDTPLMSPAWSPDGRRLAYVSFDNGKPAIYVQEVFTGKRYQVASYKGINGAPAWSPDGRQLALTLSKDGNPEIYLLNLGSRSLRRLTNHYAIDTEPAWSPDGRTIVFTSDRGGKPQIYQVPASGGRASRVTFEGSYNARASYSPDGRYLTLVTQQGRDYRIGVLELASRRLQLLSDGQLDESPSFAPNGSMVIYATSKGGRHGLAVVSVDGRMRQRIVSQERGGAVREPVWSPYTSAK
ncbi:MAG: Tol-Pal system beta propeller repeat protein TolB [Gammaproteobacteria bacterium]|nr:Tol-Pal system beta propeller repeat protein TolB [Gammaproteobacteria bacterium]